MISIRSLPIGRKGLIGGWPLRRTINQPRLIDRLCSPSNSQATIPSTITGLPARLSAMITDLDTRYQTWVQNDIDPLLGQQRHTYLQALGNEDFLALSPGERSAHRQMALGATTTALAMVSKLLAPATLPIVGTLALLGVWQGFAADCFLVGWG
jgi:hypothetical protein